MYSIMKKTYSKKCNCKEIDTFYEVEEILLFLRQFICLDSAWSEHVADLKTSSFPNLIPEEEPYVTI